MENQVKAISCRYKAGNCQSRAERPRRSRYPTAITKRIPKGETHDQVAEMAGITLAGRGGSGPYVRPLDDGGGGLPAYAAATSFTVSTETPFSDSGPVPCANGGAGEQVDLSGSLHELFHVTVDDSGAVHVTSHDNPQGINGVGETTGAKYQATGVTEDHENQGSGGLPVTFTYVNNFRVIGQGPGNNFLFHENMHVTINADGTVTASTDNARFTCM